MQVTRALRMIWAAGLLLAAWPAQNVSAAVYYTHRIGAYPGCEGASLDPTGQTDSSDGFACLFELLDLNDVLVIADYDERDGLVPATYQVRARTSDGRLVRAPHGVTYHGFGSTLRLPPTTHYVTQQQEKVLWIGRPPSEGNWEELSGHPTYVIGLRFDGNAAGQQGWVPRSQAAVCTHDAECRTNESLAVCNTTADCPGSDEACDRDPEEKLGVCRGAAYCYSGDGRCYTETQTASLFISGHPSFAPWVKVYDCLAENSTLSGFYVYYHANVVFADSASANNQHGITVSREHNRVFVYGHVSSAEPQSVHVEDQCADCGGEICEVPDAVHRPHEVVIVGGDFEGDLSWGSPGGRGSSLYVADVRAGSLSGAYCHARVTVVDSEIGHGRNDSVPLRMGHLASQVRLDGVTVRGNARLNPVGPQADVELRASDVEGVITWCGPGACVDAGPASAAFVDVTALAVHSYLEDTSLDIVDSTLGDIRDGDLALRLARRRGSVRVNASHLLGWVDLGAAESAEAHVEISSTSFSDLSPYSYALLHRNGSHPVNLTLSDLDYEFASTPRMFAQIYSADGGWLQLDSCSMGRLPGGAAVYFNSAGTEADLQVQVDDWVTALEHRSSLWPAQVPTDRCDRS